MGAEGTNLARGPGDDAAAAGPEQARRRAAALAAEVRRRDRRETVVAVLLVPVFLLGAWNAPTPLASVGALVVAVTAALIPLRLRAARRADPDPGLPATTALRLELERVRAQERLLGSVGAWYLGPLGLGLALFLVGITSSAAWRGAALALLVGTYAAIWWLNRRAVQRDVVPLVHALEASIRDVENEGRVA